MYYYDVYIITKGDPGHRKRKILRQVKSEKFIVHLVWLAS